jgi:hypothetical protein
MNLCFAEKKTKDAAYRSLTKRKNARMRDRFAATAFSERMIFVPHCLRNAALCKAPDAGSYYRCVACGACKIAALQKRADEHGYAGLYIVKGGRTIEKLMREHHPKAVLGVACYFEGAQGMEATEKAGMAVQFVPLTKDGCENTDCDLAEVLSVIDLTKLPR